VRTNGTRTVAVLGGGGARGACQVGMLRAMLEAGIEPDVVLGVSVGALNGAMLAQHPGSDGVAMLEETWRGRDFTRVFPSGRWHRYLRRVPSVYDPRPLVELIEQHVTVRDLSETKVPLEVLLADVATGEGVWFDHGPPAELLYGSSAIPGIFPPLVFEGRRYVDGGMVDPNPVLRALAHSPTRIVLLVCGSLRASFFTSDRPFLTLMRAYDLRELELLRLELGSIPQEIETIVLECAQAANIDVLDFSKAPTLLALGYRAAMRRLEQV
jgi:NTE family protein